MNKSTLETEYVIIIQLLQDERKRTGLTQKQVAKRLGTTQSKVSRIENGDYRMDILDLMNYCKALGTDVKNFFKNLETESPLSVRESPAKYICHDAETGKVAKRYQKASTKIKTTVKKILKISD